MDSIEKLTPAKRPCLSMYIAFLFVGIVGLLQTQESLSYQTPFCSAVQLWYQMSSDSCYILFLTGTSSTGSASESFPKSGPRTEFFAHGMNCMLGLQNYKAAKLQNINLIILGAREGETSSHDPFGDPKIPSDVDDWRHVETVHTNIFSFLAFFAWVYHKAIGKDFETGYFCDEIICV